MKNRFYGCCCAFFSLIIVFSFVNYNSIKQANERNDTTQLENRSLVAEKNVKAVSVGGKASERLDDNANYVEQSYDLADGVYSDQKQALPKEYAGLTREELEKKLSQYSKNSSKEDKKKGLLYVTVVSFSKEAVTVRKVYDNKSNYKYYISEKDGFVVVYSNDKKTIVDETGIEYKNLAESQKQEVNQGVYIDDLSQLYSTLESYTS